MHELNITDVSCDSRFGLPDDDNGGRYILSPYYAPSSFVSTLYVSSSPPSNALPHMNVQNSAFPQFQLKKMTSTLIFIMREHLSSVAYSKLSLLLSI